MKRLLVELGQLVAKMGDHCGRPFQVGAYDSEEATGAIHLDLQLRILAPALGQATQVARQGAFVLLVGMAQQEHGARLPTW